MKSIQKLNMKVFSAQEFKQVRQALELGVLPNCSISRNFLNQDVLTLSTRLRGDMHWSEVNPVARRVLSVLESLSGKPVEAPVKIRQLPLGPNIVHDNFGHILEMINDRFPQNSVSKLVATRFAEDAFSSVFKRLAKVLLK